MLKYKKIHKYYKALINKETAYEGIFFVGAKTTGIFCRPACPAKKPKLENCEFFETAKEALLASFRPCKRCRPLSHPNQVSATVRTLVNAIEADPEKRWKEQDFRKLSIDESTARRQFKNRFGMTFVEYARCRRMGLALKHIKEGNAVIDAQLTIGYGSSSGFCDAFTKAMGAAPTRMHHLILKAAWLDTKLGPMIGIADENGLYLLEFVDRLGLESEVLKLKKRFHAVILPGETDTIKSVDAELVDYFNGTNLLFKTPIHLFGSPFQKNVWHELRKIPPGVTCSYSEIAKSINVPTACRAVARANGANQLAIIVPCHRVINSTGEIGGYGGGVARKQWLLEHEKRFT